MIIIPKSNSRALVLRKNTNQNKFDNEPRLIVRVPRDGLGYPKAYDFIQCSARSTINYTSSDQLFVYQPAFSTLMNASAMAQLFTEFRINWVEVCYDPAATVIAQNTAVVNSALPPPVIGQQTAIPMVSVYDPHGLGPSSATIDSARQWASAIEHSPLKAWSHRFEPALLVQLYNGVSPAYSPVFRKFVAMGNSTCAHYALYLSVGGSGVATATPIGSIYYRMHVTLRGAS
jgi:hypothetical protein